MCSLEDFQVITLSNNGLYELLFAIKLGIALKCEDHSHGAPHLRSMHLLSNCMHFLQDEGVERRLSKGGQHRQG